MIKARAQNRGRTSGVFSRPEHNDGIRRLDFVLPGFSDHPQASPTKPKQKHEHKQSQQLQEPMAFACFSAHPWAKNSEISCEEIAPCRRTYQRFSSSVRSTMVEATSRGEVPPSTMIEMRSFSCSRTACAVVHSDSPLKLAEVAVI